MTAGELERSNILDALQELVAAGDDCVSGKDDVAAMVRFADADQAARAMLKQYGRPA